MAKKAALIGLFSAAAIILGYVESLIPAFIGIPGVKLGLANLLVLYVLEIGRAGSAVLINLIRILVIGFLFGNLFSIIYSLAGASLSMMVMMLLIRTKKVSVPAVSMAGGISHNIGQLIIAAFLVDNARLLLYAPVLVISGILTCLINGIITAELLKRIPDPDRFTG